MLKIDSMVRPLVLVAIGIMIVLIISPARGMSMSWQQTHSTNTTQGGEKSPLPAANPTDVASMDAVIAALYDVISGPAGKKRDWGRMRSLFIPGAQLIACGKRPNGEFVYRVMDVEGYISSSGNYLETNGFFEREVARRGETFGNIAHVFSTYEARQRTEDAKPFMRGINNIQLMNDGKRWWIVSVYWQAESADNPLPEKYLK
ncbi:MAG: hypothetical protein AB1489_38650 [Acidobacteriota bacterium]